ncbi:hypothetical protein E4P29_25435 [Rhodococcus sp. 1R11]|uniref:hypothetical protein n=1 Tax=Rhodococcus sp. 1R11 TaxID=2559614 RepID=UPI00107246E0|nr:hypothetical protein [Rhodococcus sp. 1R11]TFI40257.1 hypothetical protein E4P29_25435 [Rhodococcus sp. 1R11]
MKVTGEQLLELLAHDSHPDAVWVMHEDRTTEIVVPATPEALAELHQPSQWPAYLIRIDLAENYIRDHGLDGAVTLLNITFSIIPEPDSKIVRAAAITGRFLNRRRRQEQQ